jgi:hypothetical protein
LQFFVARRLAFAGFAAFGSRLVGGGHGTVSGDVFFGFFVIHCCYRKHSNLRK